MKLIKKIHAVISGCLNGIGFVLTLSVPVIMLVQVLLRYVFKAPLMGTEELLQFPTIWMYMLGAALASMTRTHIECGVLSVYVKSERIMAVVGIFKNIVTVVVGVWLTKWCVWYAMYSLEKAKISALLHIPQFVGDSALAVGVLLMTVYGIADLVISLSTAKTVFSGGGRSPILEKGDDAT